MDGYIRDIVSEYGGDIVESRIKGRLIPLTPSIMEIIRGDPEDPETAKWMSKCMKLGGKLQYIAIGTRPDIGAALSCCMRTAAAATQSTYNGLIFILRFLRDTSHYKIRYGHRSPHELHDFIIKYTPSLHMDIWRDDDIIWFADASQGGEKPLQCNIGFYNGAPFSWKVNNFKWTT